MTKGKILVEVPRVAVFELIDTLNNATEGEHAIKDCGWDDSKNNAKCATCQLAVIAKHVKEAYNGE